MIRWLRIRIGRTLFGWGLRLLRPEIQRTWDSLASAFLADARTKIDRFRGRKR